MGIDNGETVSVAVWGWNDHPVLAFVGLRTCSQRDRRTFFCTARIGQSQPRFVADDVINHIGFPRNAGHGGQRYQATGEKHDETLAPAGFK